MLRWLYRWADGVRQQRRARVWPADQALGRTAEDMAHRYLEREGMVVVGRNWRTPGGSGEVDLIAREGEDLVFVEVKSRGSDEAGAPERAVGEQKRRSLRAAAERYVEESGHDRRRVRFDLVSVVFDAPRPVVHERDAFRMD